MEKKYELVKEDSITVDGFKLFRIRALKDFFVSLLVAAKSWDSQALEVMLW